VTGQPKLTALASSIEEAGGDDVIFDRIADGAYLTVVAEEWDVSSQLLRKWIRLTPERAKLYEIAKRHSADALVEDAGKTLDTASTVSSQHIAKARAKAGFKQWLASKRDREQYGDEQAQVNLNLSLGGLHLDALRTRARVIEVPPEDTEILDHEEPRALSAGSSVRDPSPDRERAVQDEQGGE